MANLIKLYDIEKILYSFEFNLKHGTKLEAIQAWHTACNEKKPIDTPKVSRRKAR